MAQESHLRRELTLPVSDAGPPQNVYILPSPALIPKATMHATPRRRETRQPPGDKAQHIARSAPVN